jgi:hypothetical protein
MTLKDIRGLALTGATPAALAPFEAAVADLQCYRGDPVAGVDAAIEAAPGFAMAHALKAWLHLLGTEPSGLPVARAAHADAATAAGTARERGHVAAIGHLIDGRWHEAGRVLEDVAIDAPRDALALLAGHQIDFFTGHADAARPHRRALPAWDEGVPGFHSMLGMHAFGLEETGRLRPRRGGRPARGRARAARRLGPARRRACARDAEPPGRRHRLDARQPRGLGERQLLRRAQLVAPRALPPRHGRHRRGAACSTTRSTAGRPAVILDMVDASALLWRLQLRGVDVGDRWQRVADNWAPVAVPATTPSTTPTR